MKRPNPATRFGARLLELNLSQLEVSEMTGLHPVRISKFANGAAVPSPEQAALLTAALRCRVADLVGFVPQDEQVTA